MVLNGIDVSGWQPASITRDVDYDFVFIKATEGTFFVSDVCDTQYQAAKARGKLLGVYHFASTGNPVAEAEFFYNNIKGYIGEAIPVLDFEAAAVPAWGDSGARDFLDHFYNLSGVRPLVYVSASVATNLHKVAAGDYGLWVAEWGFNHQSGYINPGPVSTGAFAFAAVHQYTSRGRLPGYDGDLDLNIAYLDKDAWHKYAAVGGNVSKTPQPNVGGKTVQELAQEVWDRKWGDGEERVKRLREAGYDPKAVQDLVDLQAAERQKTMYTVKPGDTLSAIASKYNTTWQELAKKNNISNPDLIYPGDQIVV